MTPKQERYAQAIASGTMSQSDAYRSAGYGGKSSPATINNDSHKLAQHPDIVTRVSELRSDMMAVTTYDATALMADLQRTAKNAAESGQYSASVRALELLGKMIGHSKRYDGRKGKRHSWRKQGPGACSLTGPMPAGRPGATPGRGPLSAS